MRNGHRVLWWYALAATVVVLDQLTKAMASDGLAYGQPLEILPVLNFTLQHNSGAAFSFLSDAGGWQRYFFSAVALVVSAVLMVWLHRLRRDDLLLAIGLGLILGGALGNLWDRLVLGYVVDFISVHYHDSYFPAFNIADGAITLGAGCVILDGFRARDDQPG